MIKVDRLEPRLAGFQLSAAYVGAGVGDNHLPQPIVGDNPGASLTPALRTDDAWSSPDQA